MNAPSLFQLKTTLLDPTPGYADLVDAAPRLAGGVRALEVDRSELLAAFAAYGDAPSDPQIAGGLIDRLAAYRQRAADLLYQAYEVDLGGET
jgi:hypothetical protein